MWAPLKRSAALASTCGGHLGQHTLQECCPRTYLLLLTTTPIEPHSHNIHDCQAWACACTQHNVAQVVGLHLLCTPAAGGHSVTYCSASLKAALQTSLASHDMQHLMVNAIMMIESSFFFTALLCTYRWLSSL